MSNHSGVYTVVLSGVGLTETVELDVSSIGFDNAPAGIAQVVDTGAQISATQLFASYALGGSTSTQAQVVLFRPDGQPIPTGPVSFSLILWSR